LLDILGVSTIEAS